VSERVDEAARMLVGLAAIAAIALSCSVEQGSGPVDSRRDGSASPSWPRLACSHRPFPPGVVACVDGAAITRSQVERQLRLHPPGTSPRGVLDAMIAEELLARRAMDAGLWSADLDQAWTRDAVRALLTQTFEMDYGPTRVTDDDVRKAYYSKGIRTLFDHVDAYFVVDAQFLCCAGNPGQCDKPDIHACLQKMEPQARGLYDALRTRDTPTSPHAFKARVDALAPMYPGVALLTYSFFYDVKKSHKEQRGYDVVDEHVARGVAALRPGETSEPILSHAAWHVLFLEKVTPESHRGPDDPAVRSEIVEKIFPFIRSRDAQAFILDASKRLGVAIQFDALDAAWGHADETIGER